MKKFNLEPRPIYPFQISDDFQPKTKGIDYYQVSDKCCYMLVDCQGMLLDNAKYDHHLSMIIYLISK